MMINKVQVFSFHFCYSFEKILQLFIARYVQQKGSCITWEVNVFL